MTVEYLRDCFDVVFPFKEHYIADLSVPLESFVAKHHRYYARKALREANVEISQNDGECLEKWMHLYSTLINRHHITGIRVFSRVSFRKQLEISGMTVLLARMRNQVVGGNWSSCCRGLVYSHLSAFSPLEVRNTVGIGNITSISCTWRWRISTTPGPEPSDHRATVSVNASIRLCCRSSTR